ncbi:penicillin amidase family protein, partial [Pseudomonas syringae pv. actinidiae ICMP 18804]
MSRALPCFLFAGLSVAVVLPAQALVAHEQKAAGAEIRRTG